MRKQQIKLWVINYKCSYEGYGKRMTIERSFPYLSQSEPSKNMAELIIRNGFSNMVPFHNKDRKDDNQKITIVVDGPFSECGLPLPINLAPKSNDL